MRTLASLEKSPTLVCDGSLLLRRAARSRARTQAAKFGSFDESATRALVKQLNADTERYGRQIAMLTCLSRPVVNLWATMVRGALPALELASATLHSGVLTEQVQLGWWFSRRALLHVHDARVFVNSYVPHPPEYHDTDYLYVDTVAWHAERHQWEMPYSYNEFARLGDTASTATASTQISSHSAT